MSETSNGIARVDDRQLALNEELAAEARVYQNQVASLVVNWVRDRTQYLQRWLDPRRNLEYECGHPEGNIPPAFYQAMHERNEFAARVNEIYPEEAFQVLPEIYEDEDAETETAWEARLKEVIRGLSGQKYYQQTRGNKLVEICKRLNIMSRIGSYGIALVGLDDNLPLDQPAAMRPPAKKSSGGNGKKGGSGPLDASKVPHLTDNPSPQGALNDWSTAYPDERPFTVNPTVPVKQALGLPVLEPKNGTGPDVYTDAQLVKKQGIPAPPRTAPSGGTEQQRECTFIQVFPEAFAVVAEYDVDERSPRFGMPLRYQVTFGDSSQNTSGGANVPTVTKLVHWTRVVHVTEGRQISESKSYPACQQVLNRVLDCKKIHGPDAEGFFKNGIPIWAFETHPELGSVDLDKTSLKREWEAMINSMQRLLTTEGGTLKALTTALADPKPHVEIQVEAICIKIGCPVPVFKGYEIGEQASTNNDSDWKKRVRQYRDTHVTPNVIIPLIERLIDLYVLPEPEAEDGIKCDWDEPKQENLAEQATIASTRVTAIATFFDPAKALTNEMAPIDFWTLEMGYDDETAKQIIENAEEEKEKRKLEAEEQAAKDQEMQLDMQEQQGRISMEQGLEQQARMNTEVPAAEGEDELAKIASDAGVTTNQDSHQDGDSGVANVFCATGKGGGIDPTCGKGKASFAPVPGTVAGTGVGGGAKVSRTDQAAADKNARAILDRAKTSKLSADDALKLADHMSKMSVSQLRKMRQDYDVKLGGTNFKQDFADQLRQRILDKHDQMRGQPQPQPTPQPKPTPQPQPQPVVQPQPQPAPLPAPQPKPTSTLPHPELDPARPPLTIKTKDDPDRRYEGLTIKEAETINRISGVTKTDWFKADDSGLSDATIKDLRKAGNVEISGEHVRLTIAGVYAVERVRSTLPSGGDVEIRVPRTRSELTALSGQYAKLSLEDQHKMLDYFGIPRAPKPDRFDIEANLKRRIEDNLNPVPIDKALRDSPHNSVADRVAALGPGVSDLKAFSNSMKQEGELRKRATVLERQMKSETDFDKRKELRNQVKELRRQAGDLSDARMNARLGVGGSKQEAHQLIHEELQKYGTGHKVDASNYPDHPAGSAAIANAGINSARQFLDGKVIQRPGDPKIENVVTTVPDKGDRANYNPYGRVSAIELDTFDGAPVAVHEYGHHIDEKVPGAMAASLKFLEHRVGNEVPTKMKDLYPNSKYKDDEYGRKDDFDKAFDTNGAYYVGKDYNGRFTEVVSMGVQKLYEDPINFAKKDPEYFKFVMGILSGEHRRKTIPES